SPDDAPVEPVVLWMGAVADVHATAGLEVSRVDVWHLDNGDLREVPASEPRPRDAARWVGAHLWLEGEGAPMGVAGASGLYTLRGAKERRVRVKVATPSATQLPACCA